MGIAALTAPGQDVFALDGTTIALRAPVEHRDDLVKTRTETLNRFRGLLTQLVAAGAPTGLSADTAAQLLRTVRRPNRGIRQRRRAPLAVSRQGPSTQFCLPIMAITQIRQAAPTTSANVPQGKATEKPYDA